MKFETENIILSIISMISLAAMGIPVVFMIIDCFKFINSSDDLLKDINEILMFLLLLIAIIIGEVFIIKEMLLKDIYSIRNNKKN